MKKKVYGSHIRMRRKMCNMTWSAFNENVNDFNGFIIPITNFFVLSLFLEVFFFLLNDHYFCVWWNCSMKWKQSLKRWQQQVVEKEERKLKSCFKIFFWMEKKNLSVNIFYTYETFLLRTISFFIKKGKCAKTCHNKKYYFWYSSQN